MSHVTGLIDAVLTGRVLSVDDDERFRAHLRGCAECRARYDQALAVLRLARGGPDALAPGEAQRLEVRARRLARPVEGTPRFPWRLVWAGAAVTAALLVALLAWPASPVGAVLVASKGFLVDGAAVEKDAVLLAGAELSTDKEDAAILLSGARGRRGLLLRPGTRLRLHASDEVTLEAGRLRVQNKKAEGPFLVRAEGGRVEQAAPGVFVVERRESVTLVAVHLGTITVVGRGAPVEVKEGQEAELSLAGDLSTPKAASASALVEDRGTVWDAILRFLRSLVDAIARALAD